jgi:hypothetical protein
MEETDIETPDLFMIRTSSNNYKNKLQEAIYTELRPLHSVLIHASPQAVLDEIKKKVEPLNRYYSRCAAHRVTLNDFDWNGPAISIGIPMTETSFMTISLNRVKEARTELWKGGVGK